MNHILILACGSLSRQAKRNRQKYRLVYSQSLGNYENIKNGRIITDLGQVGEQIIKGPQGVTLRKR